MVTIATIKKSIPSRPRKAVVFWAWVCLLIAGAGFGLWLGMKFVPTLLADLADRPVNILGEESNFRVLLVDIILPFGQFVFFFPAYILLCTVANFRAFYLLFSIPATILAVGVWGVGAIAILVPKIEMASRFIPARLVNLCVKFFPYTVMGWCGFMLFFLLLGIFYNVSHPIAYGAIYRLRSKRIRLSKDGKEKRRVKKLFYKYYKKGQCQELLGLLVEPYLTKEYEGKLPPEATYFMKLNVGNVFSEGVNIKIDSLLKENKEVEARDIYIKQVENREKARNGDFSYLNGGGTVKEAEPKVIVKKVKVYVHDDGTIDEDPHGKKHKKTGEPEPKVDKRPIDDPLWSPEEI